jgi:hypothetical protein
VGTVDAKKDPVSIKATYITGVCIFTVTLWDVREKDVVSVVNSGLGFGQNYTHRDRVLLGMFTVFEAQLKFTIFYKFYFLPNVVNIFRYRPFVSHFLTTFDI